MKKFHALGTGRPENFETSYASSSIASVALEGPGTQSLTAKFHLMSLVPGATIGG